MDDRINNVVHWLLHCEIGKADAAEVRRAR